MSTKVRYDEETGEVYIDNASPVKPVPEDLRHAEVRQILELKISDRIPLLAWYARASWWDLAKDRGDAARRALGMAKKDPWRAVTAPFRRFIEKRVLRHLRRLR